MEKQRKKKIGFHRSNELPDQQRYLRRYLLATESIEKE